MAEKKLFHVEVAEQLIQQIKSGTAPWQQPWKPGELALPYNPMTGQPYHGFNTLFLMIRHFNDPRWMTYKQAQAKGWQVRKGEKGTIIQYVKTHDKESKLDEHGKPVLDDKGHAVTEQVKLKQPKLFHAVVFNASQIEGVPTLEKRALEWNPHERAESILLFSDAQIFHDQADRAFYTPRTDSIHLPAKSQFPNADDYYSTAFHELSHWTGHATRLNRDIPHPHGSPEYAKEELRAEIASLILGNKIGVGYQPHQTASYVADWVEVLKNDPHEIFRASADADKIQKFIRTFDHVQELTLLKEKNLSTIDRHLEHLQKTGIGKIALEKFQSQAAPAPERGRDDNARSL